MAKFKQFYKSYPLPTYLNLIRWLSIDIYRKVRFGEVDVHLQGIYAYVGEVGSGKTIAMTTHGLNFRNKFGDKIYICSNYNVIFQDFPYLGLQTLVADYDKPVLFLLDELQTVYTNTDFTNFPTELFFELTHTRHGKHGKQIRYTTQLAKHINIKFRELANFYIECVSKISIYKNDVQYRLTFCRYFTKVAFNTREALNDNIFLQQAIRPMYIEKIVQSDYIRSLYDTHGFISQKYIKSISTNFN